MRGKETIESREEEVCVHGTVPLSLSLTLKSLPYMVYEDPLQSKHHMTSVAPIPAIRIAKVLYVCTYSCEHTCMHAYILFPNIPPLNLVTVHSFRR